MLPPKVGHIENVSTLTVDEVCEILKKKGAYFYSVYDLMKDPDEYDSPEEYRKQSEFFDRVIELLESGYEGELADEELMAALRKGMTYDGPLRKL